MPRPRGHIQRGRPWTEFARKSPCTNLADAKMLRGDGVAGRAAEGAGAGRGQPGRRGGAGVPGAPSRHQALSTVSDAGAGPRDSTLPAGPCWFPRGQQGHILPRPSPGGSLLPGSQRRPAARRPRACPLGSKSLPSPPLLLPPQGSTRTPEAVSQLWPGSS